MLFPAQAFSSLPAEETNPTDFSCSPDTVSRPFAGSISDHGSRGSGDPGVVGGLGTSGTVAQPSREADQIYPSFQAGPRSPQEPAARAWRSGWPPSPARDVAPLAHHHSQRYKPSLHLTPPPKKSHRSSISATSLPCLPDLQELHAYVAGRGSGLTAAQVADASWLAAKLATHGKWHREIERAQKKWQRLAPSSSSSQDGAPGGWGRNNLHQQQQQQHDTGNRKHGAAARPARYPVGHHQLQQQQQQQQGGKRGAALRIQTLLDPLIAHHLPSMPAKALSQVLWSWPKTGHVPLWSLTQSLMEQLQLRVCQEACELLPGKLPPQLLSLIASGTAEVHPERLVWEVQQHQKQQQEQLQQQHWQQQQQQEHQQQLWQRQKLFGAGYPLREQQQQQGVEASPEASISISSSSSSAGLDIGGTSSSSSSSVGDMGSQVMQAQALAQLGYTLGTIYYALGRLRDMSQQWELYAERQAELLAPVTAVVFGELTQIPSAVLEARAAASREGQVQPSHTSSSSSSSIDATSSSRSINGIRPARLVETLCVLLYSATRLGFGSSLLKEQLMIPLLQHLLPRIPSLTPDQLALVFSSLAILCRESLPVAPQQLPTAAAAGGRGQGEQQALKPGRDKGHHRFVRHMIEESHVWDTSGWEEEEVNRQWQRAGGQTSSSSSKGSWGEASRSSSGSSRRWGEPPIPNSSSSRGGKPGGSREPRSRLELFESITPPSIAASHAMAILDVFQSCCKHILAAAPAAKRPELITYAWCLATCCGPTSRLTFIPPYLGMVHQPLEAIAAILLESGGTMELHPDQIARLVWSYGKLMYNHDQFFDALADAAVAKARYMSPQDLANTAWGFASVNHSHPELVEVLSREAVRKMSGFKPLELCNMLWSFAVLDHWDPRFSAAAEGVVAGWDLMDLHWSLQKQLLQVHHAHLFKWTTSYPSPEAKAAVVGRVEAAAAAAAGGALRAGKQAAALAAASQARGRQKPLPSSSAAAAAGGREGGSSSICSSWNTRSPAINSSSSSSSNSRQMGPEGTGHLILAAGPLFTLPEDQLPQLRSNIWNQQDVFRESLFQQEVFDTLKKKLKLVTDLEVLIEDLDTKIDAVVYYKGLQICLETDGPHHYTMRHPRVRAGRSVLRDRMMDMAGLLTAVVPVHEWRALEKRQKPRYLLGVLEEAKKRHEQKKVAVEAAAAAAAVAAGDERRGVGFEGKQEWGGSSGNDNETPSNGSNSSSSSSSGGGDHHGSSRAEWLRPGGSLPAAGDHVDRGVVSSRSSSKSSSLRPNELQKLM